MTAPAVALSAEAEAEVRRAEEAEERLSRFIDELHAACSAVRPKAPWPWGTRMQVPWNERQDTAADGLLDKMHAELEGIEDIAERCLASEALIKAVDTRCDRARYERDIGLIVMLFTHYDGWKQYKRAKDQLDAELNRGDINAEEHRQRQLRIEDTRRSDRSGARWRPTSAGALARVSRGLVNSQIKKRIPAALGESLRADTHGPEVATPTMEQAERMAEENGRIVRYCGGAVAKAGTGADNEKTIIPPHRSLRNLAQEVRNGVMDAILDGAPDGGLGWQNVVLASALGISTARVAQVRRFTR